MFAAEVWLGNRLFRAAAAVEAPASASVEAPAKAPAKDVYSDKYGTVPPTFLASINTVKKNLKKYINNNKSTITIKSVFTNYNDSYNEENAIKDGEILAAIINNCDKSCKNYYDSIKEIIAKKFDPDVNKEYLYTVVKTYNENLKDKVKDEYKIYQRIDFPKPPVKSALKKTGGRTRRKKQKKTKKQKKRKNTKKRKTQKKHKKNRKTRRKLKLK